MSKEIAIIWNTEDIRGAYPHLTEVQADLLLRWLEQHHDCNQGINWDVIENTMDEIGMRKLP
jgi:hypothetical protein